jgi:SAM-dependent methyltransferase
MKDFLNIFIIIRKRGFRFFWDYFKESIWFDLRFGTSTFLRVPKIKQKIKIEDNRNDDGLLYVASFTSVIFKTLFKAEDIMGSERFRQAQFIDLGCGKGKTLIIYKKYLKDLNTYPPIGLEYDKELVNLSLKNLAKLSFTEKDIEVYYENALNLRKYIKSKEAIIYLYNSFKGKTFDDILDCLKDLPHVLIYIDPVERSKLTVRGYEIVAKNNGRYNANTWIVATLSL